MDQYTIPFMMSGGQAGGASLSRNSTYYFGMHASLTFGPQGTEDVSKIYVPCNCTLRRAYGNIYCSSPGSETLGATMYIKIGSIGDVTIATDIKFNQTNTAVAAQDLDTEIGSGNYVTGKIVTPNWTGGVTGVRIEILGLFD